LPPQGRNVLTAGGGGCTNRPTPEPKSRPARHSEALTQGFQRGLFGASIALVIAAVIALRAPNVRAIDMAVDADEDAGVPVPAAG
jgi:hypothetical protein